MHHHNRQRLHPQRPLAIHNRKIKPPHQLHKQLPHLHIRNALPHTLELPRAEHKIKRRLHASQSVPIFFLGSFQPPLWPEAIRVRAEHGLGAENAGDVGTDLGAGGDEEAGDGVGGGGGEFGGGDGGGVHAHCFAHDGVEVGKRTALCVGGGGVAEGAGGGGGVDFLLEGDVGWGAGEEGEHDHAAPVGGCV